ncbi:hypothetical protein ES708_22093 [subsurface metagenome]
MSVALTLIIGSYYALRQVFHLRLQIVGKLQDLIGSIAFAGFIDRAAQDYGLIVKHMRIMRMLIDAYIFIIPLPLLVSKYHEAIEKDPTLYAYFSHFPSVREHLGLIDSGATYAHTQIEKSLFEDLARLSFDPEAIIEKEDTFFTSLTNWVDAWWDMLTGEWNKQGKDPYRFCEAVVQKMNEATYPGYLYHIPEWIPMLLCPTICFDWATICACIQSYDAYMKVAYEAEWLELPRAYIPRMRVSLLAQSSETKVSTIYPDGGFKLKTEEPLPDLTDLEVGIHGLRLPIPTLDALTKIHYVRQSDSKKILSTDPGLNSFITQLYPDFQMTLLLFTRIADIETGWDGHWGDTAIRAWNRKDGYILELFANLQGEPADLFYGDKGFVTTIEARDLPSIPLPTVTSDYFIGKMKLDKETLEFLSYTPHPPAIMEYGD